MQAALSAVAGPNFARKQRRLQELGEEEEEGRSRRRKGEGGGGGGGGGDFFLGGLSTLLLSEVITDDEYQIVKGIGQKIQTTNLFIPVVIS